MLHAVSLGFLARAVVILLHILTLTRRSLQTPL